MLFSISWILQLSDTSFTQQVVTAITLTPAHLKAEIFSQIQYDALSDNVIISVRKLDASESGQMVFQQMKWAYSDKVKIKYNVSCQVLNF